MIVFIRAGSHLGLAIQIYGLTPTELKQRGYVLFAGEHPGDEPLHIDCYELNAEGQVALKSNWAEISAAVTEGAQN